ncbi:putative malate dehydrogenase 1B [Danaus plexippus plexippus]|uniref:Malate dehydrogenase 1B n=1 Tax=Danaus plexippus plexippus TaxID=278856 RepID=A0A212EKD1_DANPL|nr:putative malate dehydrogenase 1B isoform X2 [Danaus plexippus plexippus]OWR41941.1 putative malate dehydrogenase 1B [Danaus plexippus plexippus]
MNFEYRPELKPLKVYFVNPLAPASQLAIVKIMSGLVFGNEQSIDMTLVVYSNEIKSAEAFGLEIESCAFSCTNSIKVSSDLPSNPNYFGMEASDEEFDALYLTIKVALSLKWAMNKGSTLETHKEAQLQDNEPNLKIVEQNQPNPVFMTDGLVATDIIKTLSKNIPHNILFYPTPLTAIAKSVLSDYLDIPCKVINNIFVWAANDKVFHIEVQKPLIIDDSIEAKSDCDWDMVGKDLLKTFDLDSTQLSASWLKKDFIEKVASSASKNPYGSIHRAVEFTKSLKDIWHTRNHNDGNKVCRNIGCISDGSLGTIKGYPYVLPIVFQNGLWTVNDIFLDTHLKQEIKRMNNTVKECHDKLTLHCKKFLQESVDYFNAEDNSGTTFS